ncbi:type I methionyl aminopeptidase [Chengkuizengella axinellae]|uniref:Methionine aminopeptidase n=1 Tax=Chengkuizengella axinellae TaxID=3064388 RepID=A0ABT9J2B5_9BACL|nr:type I methionyl aminopeptidase [Chengkuizengella sp. 2205SS18-9]MDP5275752.1 type I methionyl aminopeptidase [Chengkuizengella sp. 2205SS18-9]
MIRLKNKNEISLMREAGILLAECHQQVEKLIKPGTTTLDIDAFVENFLHDHGAKPEQKGFHGYPYATCGSVNDVICHGFPNDTPLKEGDIVTIDFVVNLNGWLADSAWSYAVGKISEEAQQLMDTTLEALFVGINQARVGNRVGDISHAIQTFAESKNYGVVREFAGHGIGKKMHEDPFIPHFGPADQGAFLEEGMVITIEPMLNVGEPYCKIEDDGWTARTQDGSLSTQYEHTLAITKDKPFILTEL